VLPDSVRPTLEAHLARRQGLHDHALDPGAGPEPLPHAPARKQPGAARAKLAIDPSASSAASCPGERGSGLVALARDGEPTRGGPSHSRRRDPEAGALAHFQTQLHDAPAEDGYYIRTATSCSTI
jgi:hypothetical protein